MVPYTLLIAIAIFCALVAILHCISSDIQHLHRVADLTREVNEKRERYLAQLKGGEELGEVEIIGEEETVDVL